MQPLDVPTLLLVNAVFNGFAAAGWALLAAVFRMAPRASTLMVAAHALRVLALSVGVAFAAAWPVWLSDALFELSSLTTICLLALALRRMLRLGPRWRDIGLVASLAALGIIGFALAGWREGALMSLSLGMTLLGLLAVRDVLAGAGPGLAGWVTALFVLPYALLVGIGLARVLLLLTGQPFDPLLAPGRHGGVLAGAVWLVLTMTISVSLMALLVWRLVGRVEHLTRRDAMTNTLNRRAISDEMRKLQALRERGHPFALILVDIDHFKRINDEWGHAAGDAALLHFVALMRSCLRELDQLGRLGGEEFCALLPHTEVAAAAQVAERMRAALQARPLAWHDGPIAITASFGVAAGLADDPQGEASLAQADRQVYRAKDAGRNRVCVATAPD